MKKTYEDLSVEWSQKNTHPLSDFTPGTHKHAWWICKNNHEWEAEIKSRYSGCGCPYCSGRLAIKGKTDFATLYPSLINEWHPIKNGALKPDEVTAFSNKRVWWLCQKGHEWQTAISHRSEGKNCPICGKKKAEPKVGNLAAAYPEIAAEWGTKNERPPQDYRPHSNQRVWWKCKMEHEWQSVINSRTSNRGRGCPYCAGKKTIVGETDLASLRPELAREWDYEKNGNLTPQEVTEFSHRKVWWRCKNDHTWKADVKNRSLGRGCPCCLERKKDI